MKSNRPSTRKSRNVKRKKDYHLAINYDGKEILDPIKLKWLLDDHPLTLICWEENYLLFRSRYRGCLLPEEIGYILEDLRKFHHHNTYTLVDGQNYIETYLKKRRSINGIVKKVWSYHDWDLEAKLYFLDRVFEAGYVWPGLNLFHKELSEELLERRFLINVPLSKENIIVKMLQQLKSCCAYGLLQCQQMYGLLQCQQMLKVARDAGYDYPEFIAIEKSMLFEISLPRVVIEWVDDI